MGTVTIDGTDQRYFRRLSEQRRPGRRQAIEECVAINNPINEAGRPKS